MQIELKKSNCNKDVVKEYITAAQVLFVLSNKCHCIIKKINMTTEDN